MSVSDWVERLQDELATANAEIERLRGALLCEDCNGIGWVYCGVADTSTPCRHCAAHEIRKAAQAAGGEG